MKVDKRWMPVDIPDGVKPVSLHSHLFVLSLSQDADIIGRISSTLIAQAHKTKLTNGSTTSRLSSCPPFSNRRCRARILSSSSLRRTTSSVSKIISERLLVFRSLCSQSKLPRRLFSCYERRVIYILDIRYSSNQDISRARLAFFKGEKSFLLVSERFHFYKRYARTFISPNSININ